MAGSGDIIREFKVGSHRRALLGSLAALGASGASILPFAEALAQASASEVSQITILSQPGVVPELVREGSFPSFKQSYPKTTVRLETATNSVAYPRMLTQRSSPVISGGMYADVFAQRGRIDGMWAMMDPALTPNVGKLANGLSTPGGFGFPFHLQPWGIIYNPDRVEAPTSWTDLWSPKLKGKVVMWDVYFDAYIIAAHVTGKGMSVEEGIRAWAPYKENIGAWVNSFVVVEDLVHRGEMLMAPHWGANAAQGMAQGKKLAFTIPREGGVQWAGHAEVTNGFSPAVTELTTRYLDVWLSDECQRVWIEKGFYTPASTAVTIPEGLRDNPCILSAEDAVKRLLRPDYVEIGSQAAKYTQLIQRVLKS